MFLAVSFCLIVRADFNVAHGERLTARHNYIDVINHIGRPDATRVHHPR